MGRKTPSGKAAMATTDENDASKASAASPRGPAGAEMMPDLPEPWEGLVAKALTAKRQDGWFTGALAVESGGPNWITEQERWNHAAFEAERALRVALGELLRDKWFLNGRDSDS